MRDSACHPSCIPAYQAFVLVWANVRPFLYPPCTPGTCPSFSKHKILFLTHIVSWAPVPVWESTRLFTSTLHTKHLSQFHQTLDCSHQLVYHYQAYVPVCANTKPFHALYACTVCTVHGALCALFMVHCVFCSWCTVCTVHGALCVLFMVHCVHCSWCTVCSVHGALCTLFMVHCVHCVYCSMHCVHLALWTRMVLSGHLHVPSINFHSYVLIHFIHHIQAYVPVWANTGLCFSPTLYAEHLSQFQCRSSHTAECVDNPFSICLSQKGVGLNNTSS